MRQIVALALGSCLAAGSALAADLTIPVNRIDPGGIGAPIGSIQASDGPEGLVLIPDLTGLPPGPHGFHVHVFPSCAAGEQNGKNVAGLAAGGHFDPDGTGIHRGPSDAGHRGDLPALTVASNGTARSAMVAPRLRLADLRGRSLVIHAGSDTYTDRPLPLGGGGARLACGVVPALP